MRTLRSFGLCSILMLCTVLVFAGCASTTLGKAIQSAEAQKKLVEAAAIEFAKLHMKGDPRITEAVYARGKAAYQKYYTAQVAEANALASWKTVSSPENESKLTAALTEVTNNINVYLALVGQFIDLSALQQKIGAEGPRVREGRTVLYERPMPDSTLSWAR